jgi:transposase
MSMLLFFFIPGSAMYAAMMLEPNAEDEQPPPSTGASSELPEEQLHHRVTLGPAQIQSAVALFNNDMPTSTVATALGCFLRTAQRLKERTQPTFIGQVRAPYAPKKRGRPEETGRREERRAEIRNSLIADPALDQGGVAGLLPVQVSRSTICRDIKAMGWSRKRLKKVPFEKNSPHNIVLRNQYATKLAGISDARLVFLDESGFNLHVSTTYGYSEAGTDAVVGVLGNRQQNLTLTAAIWQHGIVHSKLIDGAGNRNNFLEFLEEMLPSFPANAILIMDNVAFHRSQPVREWLGAHNIAFEYLPPYSPELNPIEEFFHQVKARYSRIHPVAQHRAVMRDRLSGVLHALRYGAFSGFFRDMRRYLATAQAGQPLNNAL